MPFRIEPVRDRTLNRLVKQADLLELPKGRTLYRPGDEAIEVWLVREGLVRLVLPGMEKGAVDRTVAVALPWEVFGDEALTEGHRRYGAVAATRCRLRHAQGGSRGPSASQRLAEVLLDLGRRCGEPAGRGIRLSERFTHQTLADLAGAHRATVTTLLNDWLYEGILGADKGGRLVLARPTGLWSRAGYHPPEAPDEPPSR